MEEPTRRQEIAPFPVRTIAVDVTSGPDAGKTARAEGERLSVGTAEGNELVLGDRHVSRYHLEIAIGANGFLLTDTGSSNGTFIGHPPEVVRVLRAIVQPGTLVRVGDTVLRVREGESTTVPLFGEDTLAGFHGRAPATRRLMAQLQRAAQSQAAVLLEGESGTGKEVLARALHALSSRAAEPFEVVDCGALVPALVASELFGHEKGAFTGADRRARGRVRARARRHRVPRRDRRAPARDCSRASSARSSDENFRRVGGREGDRVRRRVRLRDAPRSARARSTRGAFRARPLLSARGRHVEDSAAPRATRGRRRSSSRISFARQAIRVPRAALVSDQALTALAAQPWPGNVRELRNTIEALLAMGELPQASTPAANASDPIGAVLDLSYKQARDAVMRNFETRYVPHVLERAGGNIAKAARDADMDRSHLMELMRRLGLR